MWATVAAAAAVPSASDALARAAIAADTTAEAAPAPSASSEHAAADGANSEHHAEAHSEEGHAASLNPVDSWRADLAIWTAVVFLLLLFVLGRFAWKPMMEALDRREQGIADQIAQAHSANDQAKQMLAQYEQKLEAAREEVRAMLEKARRDGEASGQEIVANAREEAKNEQQRALRQIDAATAAAVKELADQAANLAVQLAGKIVGAKLSPADHAQLIEKAVSEFAQREPSRN